MATVTVSKRRTSIAGDKKHKSFTISGASGDTLDTRMKSIDSVVVTPGTNSPTVVAESTVGGYKTLTFTSAGAFTDAKILVVGN